jgi:hypothetical protein
MLDLLKARTVRRYFIADFQSELGSGAAYVALGLIAYSLATTAALTSRPWTVESALAAVTRAG